MFSEVYLDPNILHNFDIFPTSFHESQFEVGIFHFILVKIASQTILMIFLPIVMEKEFFENFLDIRRSVFQTIDT